MKVRKKVKLRTLPSKRKNDVVDIKKKTLKKMRKANERIKSISKKYKGTTYMWAVKKLKTKVGSRYFKNNRLIIPKNTSRTEMIKLYKEIESFLNSKESIKTGIKEIQERAKETINLELFDGEVTDEDVDTYYSMLEDKDFTSITSKDFDTSEFWAVIDDAINSDDTLDDFIGRMNVFLDTADETVRNKVTRLYNKYIK